MGPASRGPGTLPVPDPGSSLETSSWQHRAHLPVGYRPGSNRPTRPLVTWVGRCCSPMRALTTSTAPVEQYAAVRVGAPWLRGLRAWRLRESGAVVGEAAAGGSPRRPESDGQPGGGTEQVQAVVGAV